MSLLQSRAGGSGSSAVNDVTPNTTTSAVGYSSTTTAGSLLLCAMYVTQSATGPNLVSGPTYSIATSGISWVDNAFLSGGWTLGTNKALGRVKMFYAAGAPSITPATTTTVTATYTGSGPQANATQNVEFELYEFSGVATTSPINVTRIVVSGTTVGNGNMTTTLTDLVVVGSHINPGSAATAGTGFTLGINASLPTIGQLQYQLDTPAGTVNTNFNGTATAGQWGAFSVGFKAGTPVSTGNSSYGFFFG